MGHINGIKYWRIYHDFGQILIAQARYLYRNEPPKLDVDGIVYAFDPENIVKLALEADCNAVASTFGVLASVARKYAHKIPFVVKMNHNELLTYPNSYNQVFSALLRKPGI